MDYTQFFNRESYAFTTPKGVVRAPKKADSGRSIDAFFTAAQQATAELGCIVEARDEGDVSTFTIVHPESAGLPQLQVNYGGVRGYHAKIVLPASKGQVQVDSDNVDSAVRQVLNYLKNPAVADEKKQKKASRRMPRVSESVSGSDDDFGEYNSDR